MKKSEFNYYYNKLTSENGKRYFEEYLQYKVYFFLILTENQHNKIIELLSRWDYPIETYGATKYVKFPNGIKLLLH